MYNMIYGIGTDIVLVDRFKRWRYYSKEALKKIFSAHELKEAFNEYGDFFPEKLAVRFAAKEAFYKALSTTLVLLQIKKSLCSLRMSCKYIVVHKDATGIPFLIIDWSFFENMLMTNEVLSFLKVHLSLSHEKDLSIAFVIIEGVYGAKKIGHNI